MVLWYIWYIWYINCINISLLRGTTTFPLISVLVISREGWQMSKFDKWDFVKIGNLSTTTVLQIHSKYSIKNATYLGKIRRSDIIFVLIPQDL